MKPTKTLLTVDWDAFIPEPLEADMGHQESLLYRNVLWQTGMRGWLHDIMQTSDYADPCKFWGNIELVRDAPHYISDSHLVGWEIARDHRINKVVLVDQHHDLWPWSVEDSDIHCGNWLSAAVATLGVTEIDWYVPTFSHVVPLPGTPEGDKLIDWLGEHGATLNVYDMSEIPTDLAPSVVHVCRSSCWTPPWLDKEFARFVAPLQPHTVIGPGGDDWNPLDERLVPCHSDPAWQAYLDVGGPKMIEARDQMVERCKEWVRRCGQHTKLFPPVGSEC